MYKTRLCNHWAVDQENAGLHMHVCMMVIYAYVQVLYFCSPAYPCSFLDLASASLQVSVSECRSISLIVLWPHVPLFLFRSSTAPACPLSPYRFLLVFAGLRGDRLLYQTLRNKHPKTTN